MEQNHGEFETSRNAQNFGISSSVWRVWKTEEDCKEIQSHRVASSKDLKHERSHVHRLCKEDKALNIYSYSDTGTPMLAGIIKIN